MRSILIIASWSLLAAGVLYLMFAPGHGLMYAGPLATGGLGLLGGAICLAARKTEASADG